MGGAQIARRLRGLPLRTVLGHEVRVAYGIQARLLGLALLDPGDAGPGLLIPRCSSVHTFGMRFSLDLVFLDERERPLSARDGVGPRRIVSVRGSSAVLELPVSAAESGNFSRPGGRPGAPRA
jgi:hypothetical protein